MKKSLKILLIVVSLVLVLATLTGCGNDTETENNAGTSTKETIARGVIDENNVYTSEYADITFALPEGWVFSTDEQIASMMNVGVEILSEDEEDLTEILEQTALYDMVANDQTTGASVMVMFEKALLNVNEEFYLENIKTGLESVTQMGYEVSEDITTETVGGKEYSSITAEVPEYNMVQKYYVEKKGDYFIGMIITYIDGVTDLDSILANFQ